MEVVIPPEKSQGKVNELRQVSAPQNMRSINQFHYAKVGDKKWIKENNLWNDQYSANKNN